LQKPVQRNFAPLQGTNRTFNLATRPATPNFGAVGLPAMCISNRESRRKQDKATLKNNSKPVKPLPLQFTPITDYEVAREATNALMSYLRRAFREYTHGLKPRHIASMQLASLAYWR
jgi:hypothetical protein